MNPADFRKLRVTARDDVAEQVVRLTFEAVGLDELPAWEPGAHVELRLPSGTLRQYSLCGDLGDRHHYQVCVLREGGGRGGSQELHRDVAVGDELEAREPRNHFPLVEADKVLLLAGGIGITPIKAMVDHLSRAGAPWRLVYGGRTRASMAFLDELEAHGERVRIVPQDTAGLIDLVEVLDTADANTHVYACGPGGMLSAVEAACAARDLTDRLHLERFDASGAVEFAVPGGAGDTAFEVELAQTGVSVEVPADKTILDVVKEFRDVDYSCMEGYCGTCETAVLEGRPDHRGTFIDADEHDAEGTMLICISRALSAKLVLDL